MPLTKLLGYTLIQVSKRRHRKCATCRSARLVCTQCARMWCPRCSPLGCPYTHIGQAPLHVVTAASSDASPTKRRGRPKKVTAEIVYPPDLLPLAMEFASQKPPIVVREYKTGISGYKHTLEIEDISRKEEVKAVIYRVRKVGNSAFASTQRNTMFLSFD